MTFGRVSHEIRQRVDVVNVPPAIAIVDEVFDTANIQPDVPRNALDIRNDFRGRRVALDAQPVFWRVHGAGVANQLPAVLRLTRIRRTEVERARGREHPDAVEIVTAKNLHPHDMSAAQRCQLLHERGTIDPEIQRAAGHCRRQLILRIEAGNSRAAATNVRLDDDRKPQPARGRDRDARVIDRPCPRIGDSELLERGQLARLGDLMREHLASIDHLDSEPLQVTEPTPRRENGPQDARASSLKDSRD